MLACGEGGDQELEGMGVKDGGAWQGPGAGGSGGDQKLEGKGVKDRGAWQESEGPLLAWANKGSLLLRKHRKTGGT